MYRKVAGTTLLLLVAAGAAMVSYSVGSNPGFINSGPSVPRMDIEHAESSERSAPLVSLQRFTHDFGIVKNGKRLNHEFAVRNSSSVSWKPKQITNSCSCTIATATISEIRPGEEFIISIAFNSPRDSGRDSQTVTVRFYDDEAPVLVFTVHATVRDDLWVSLKEISVDETSRAAPSMRQIYVRNDSGTPWTGLSVSSTSPWLTFVVESPSPTGTEPGTTQQWVVNTTINTANLAFGSHKGSILIRPSNDTLIGKNVPVSLFIVPPMQVIPPQLFLGEIVADCPHEFNLLLRYPVDQCPSKPPAITVTENLAGNATIRLERCTDAPIWFLKGRISPTSAAFEKGYFRGDITIACDAYALGQVTIPLIAKQRHK